MRKVSLVGILVGGICDIATTNIVAFLLMFDEAVYLRMHSPEVDQTKALVAVLHSSFALRASLIVAGSLCSILAGYVAARIAKRSELLNGALSSSLGAGLGILSLATGRSSDPLVQQITAIAASPLFGAFGGFLCARRASRRAAAPVGTLNSK